MNAKQGKALIPPLVLLLMIGCAGPRVATRQELGAGAAMVSCKRFDQARNGLKVEFDPVLGSTGPETILGQAASWTNRAVNSDAKWTSLQVAMNELALKTPTAGGRTIFPDNDPDWQPTFERVEQICVPLLAAEA